MKTKWVTGIWCWCTVLLYDELIIADLRLFHVPTSFQKRWNSPIEMLK